MLTKSELLILLDLINKRSNLNKLGSSQKYRIIKSLKNKGILLEGSKVSSDLVLKMLSLCEIYPKLQELICDGRLSILFILSKPKSLSDVIFLTQYTRAYVLKVIRDAKKIGLVKKVEAKYVLNSEVWKEFVLALPHYIGIFKEKYKVNNGVCVYYISPKKILFSSKNEYPNYYLSAFSLLKKHDLLIYTLENYYSNINSEDTFDLFRDLLLVIEKDDDHRLKIMAILFYKKYESILKDLNLSFVNDIKLVLKGQKVSGFLPLSEIIEKGEIYDIKF